MSILNFKPNKNCKIIEFFHFCSFLFHKTFNFEFKNPKTIAETKNRKSKYLRLISKRFQYHIQLTSKFCVLHGQMISTGNT